MASNYRPGRGRGFGPRGPPRGRSRSQPRYTSNVHQDSAEDLECPVCMEQLRAPIFLCDTGHSVCEICTRNLSSNKCPLCQAAMTSRRNFALEQFIAKIPQPCPNAVYGCKYKCTSDKLSAHFHCCIFRHLFCPVGRLLKAVSCSWHGNMSSLLHHVQSEHPMHTNVLHGKEVALHNLNQNAANEDVQVMNLQGTLFLFYSSVIPEMELACWIVQMLGDSEEAKKWSYEMHLYDKGRTLRKVQVSEPCTADEADINRLIDSGSCILLPLPYVFSFMRNGKLTFKIYLRPTMKA